MMWIIAETRKHEEKGPSMTVDELVRVAEEARCAA
jgi:hypothetical protein